MIHLMIIIAILKPDCKGPCQRECYKGVTNDMKLTYKRKLVETSLTKRKSIMGTVLRKKRGEPNWLEKESSVEYWLLR